MLTLVLLTGTTENAFAKNNLLTTQDTTETTAQKAVFLLSKPSSEVILEKYTNATSLNDSQLIELLKAVGFKGKGLRTAWAVAKAESNGRPLAFNGNTKTGDSSYGIFQINMLGNLGPDRRGKFDLDLNAELFSPVTNAEIAFYMTKGGIDWRAWKHAKPIQYQRWLIVYDRTF